MEKRALSILLVLSLLMGLLSIAPINSVAATEGTDYTVTALTADDGDKAREVMSQINVAKNVSTTTDDNQGSNGFTGAANLATDGIIPGIVGETTASATEATSYCMVVSQNKYVVYDFGGSASIENILLAGPMAYDNATELGTVNIFLGNTAPVYEEHEWTATLTVDVAATVSLTTPVTARYAAVQVTSDAMRISELGFFSSKPVAVDGTGYTVEPIAYSATQNNNNGVQKPAAYYNGIYSYAEYISGVMKKDNLLKGVSSHKYYSTTDFTAAGNAVTDANFLTDGVIGGVSQNADVNNTANWSFKGVDATYLYYDLGGWCDVSSLLYVGSAPEYAGWGNNANNITVYMSSKSDGLVEEENEVFAETSLKAGVVMTLKTAKNAVRYVAIKLSGAGNHARISELGVYGEKVCTLETITGAGHESTEGAWLREVVQQHNVLKGLTPKFSATNITGTPSVLTDGIIPSHTGNEDDSKVYFETDEFATKPQYIYYDMGGVTNVEQFLIAGATITEISNAQYGWASKLGTLEIYMSSTISDPVTLVNTESAVVAAEDMKYGGLFTMTTPIRARYVAVKFTHKNDARISELGVYSGYGVETLTGTADAERAQSILSKINVAKNVSTTTDDNQGSNGFTGAANLATDGIIPGIVGETTASATKATEYCMVVNKNRYVVYDFGGFASIENILLAGPMAYNEQQPKLGTVNIFLGNTNAVCDNPEWLTVLQVDAASIITLDTPVTARYAAVQVTTDSLRISELGFYSSKPVAVDKDGYTVESIAYSATYNSEKKNNPDAFYNGITSYKTYIEDVMKADNLLRGASSPRYFSGTDFSGAGTAVPNAAYLTDRRIDGVTVTDGTMDLKAVWPTSDGSTYGSTYLYYDLGNSYNVSSLLYVGSAPEYASWKTTANNITVFMSSELTGLVAEDNKVFEATGLKAGVFMTLNTAKSARYIAIKLDGTHARISELGVYPEGGAIKYTAPNSTEYGITFIDGPNDADKLPTDSNWLQLAGVYHPTLYKESSLENSTGNPNVEGENEKNIADGDVPGVNSTNSSATNKVFWSIEENGSYLLFDFGEGNVCQKIDRVLVAGSYHEYKSDGSAMGDVTIYLGDDKTKLISDENCYGTISGANVAGMITLSEPVNARYVAIKFDGHDDGYARVSEVGVYCAEEAPGVNVSNRFTGTTEDGKFITVTVQRTFDDLYSADFLNSIKGVRLVKKDLPDGVPSTIDNGLLKLADKSLYTLELYDADDEAIITDAERMILVQLPNLGTEFNTMAICDDSTLTRVWNAQPTKEGDTMLLGTDAGNKGSVYYTGPIDLVYLTYNAPDQVREVTGRPQHFGFNLIAEDNATVVEY